MKPYKTVVVIFFILAVETQCGIIDDVYGKVKNMSLGIKQDVRNVWLVNKRIIGLSTENPSLDNRTEEEKRGLIGGAIHSAHEKVHSIKNYFWNTDEYSTDAGIVGNMFNRVKNRLSKIKGSVLGNDPNVTKPPASENERLIRNTLNKLFFGNGTRQVHGQAFREAVENLRRKLHQIRNNFTTTTIKPEDDGEGMIDIRTAIGSIGENINDNTAGIDNDIYDKVDDGLNGIKDKTVKSYNNMQENIGEGMVSFRNGVNNAGDDLSRFASKVSEATAARENELLVNGLNSINANVQRVGDDVKDKLDDAKWLSYQN